MNKELTRLVLQEKDHTIKRLEAVTAALLAVCEAYLHLLDRPAPIPDGCWDELVTAPMRAAVKLAESVQASSGETS